MTEREQFDFFEKKQRIYFQRGGTCEVCREFVDPGNYQLGHRIPQTKKNLEAFGKRIIHHELNMALVCDLICNKKVDLAGKPAEQAELLIRINDAIAEEDGIE